MTSLPGYHSNGILVSVHGYRFMATVEFYIRDAILSSIEVTHMSELARIVGIYDCGTGQEVRGDHRLIGIKKCRRSGQY